MTVITELARAKVNLTLQVMGKRPDGYHELASLVAFADAADIITLDTSQRLDVSVSGPFGGGIAGQNLIEVTLRKLADAAPDLLLGAVRLQKNLPVAAGIGGGSADAAAVLRAVRHANPDISASVDWMGVARTLGADVPVCFLNETAWMTGIGETLASINAIPSLQAVLVNPLMPMPSDKTARIFRALGAVPVLQHTVGRLQKPEAFLSAEALIGFMRHHGNDLEAAALKELPVVETMKQILLSTPGCKYAALSGAGPTCFGIFDNAKDVAAAISQAKPNWWVKAVLLGNGVSASG